MKSFQVLLFALIALNVAFCSQLQGYSSLTTPGNSDYASCLQTLTYSLGANSISYSESVSDPSHDCTYHNLTFLSFFRTDSVSGSVVMSGSPIGGTFNLSTLAAQNGSACLFVGSYSSENWYSCRFMFSSIPVQMEFMVSPTTGQIDTTWTNLLFPEYGVSHTGVQNGVSARLINSSYPNLVGGLYSTCGTWDSSSVISSLSTPFTVTGTISLSQRIDFNSYLSGFFVNNIVVKQRGAKAGVYNQYIPTTYVYPFANVGTGNCTQINGLTYASILPSLSYCAGTGCEVSLFLEDDNHNFYVLQTAGITSKSSLRI